MIEEAKTWNDKYELTKPEQDKYDESTNCCFCKANFKKKNLVKVIHHRWNQKVERGPNNEVLKGNFIGAACSPYNIKISYKRAELPCFAHNSSKYDS